MHLTGELTKAMAGGFSRRSRFAFALVPASLLLFNCYAAAAQPDLYSATVIVTGRDNLAERSRGIREALPLVLLKLTVDESLVERATAQGLADAAETLVERLDYLDRKEGIQISDEQGTRERSFELTVHFDEAKIDSIVERLGGIAWTDERPRIDLALRVDDGVSTYLVTRLSEKGYGQRLAIEDEAEALALPVVLPEADSATEARQPSSVQLDGHMTITAAGYWNTAWRLRGEELDERFNSTETTFDAAIGEALRRSAKTLAKR